MSYVYFSDGVDGAELAGPERHYARHLATSLGFSCLDADELAGGRPSRVRAALSGRRRSQWPGGPVLAERIDDLLSLPVGPGFTEALRREVTGFRDRVVFDLPLSGGGRGRIVPEELLLNTAVVAGSDAVALLARLHAHCEVHAWVDGPDRSWLADLVEAGRSSGVLRSGVGWEGVAAFLRSDASRPVVTSASVSETFPTAAYARFDPAELLEHAPCVARADEEGVDPFDLESCTHEDAWYDLDYDLRWSRALEGLRSRPDHPGLQVSPTTLHVPMFAPGSTAFDL